MDREQLAARHTGVIRRHWRTLTDTGGQPGPALLVELADLADEHARTDPSVSEELAAEVREGLLEAERGETVDLGDFAQHAEPKATTAKPATTRKPAATRTTTRRSPK